ncbi:hypothetical protein NBRC110019_09390 [Neptunitalea chrysea]|uniref:Type 1 periplasmic binding fold superfamily protein n=2 Tax=Neptunitalea chrysea TaxID=1647581 RepID=A0A9W6B5A1_9FLAO|nr:hypothetical protein NBRC110019_09390 [Neptunitalea chrysea]
MSCSSDDDTPEVINEEEVITTMNVTLTNGSQVITLQSQDLDGDGPNDPVLTVSGNLAANTTYSGVIELLNETESPAEDVTEEVADENTDHQFFFITGGSAIASTSYSDTDDDGKPLGIDFSLVTGSAGTASLTITLIHQPDKDASGVSDGDITNAGGETDFTATYAITVE